MATPRKTKIVQLKVEDAQTKLKQIEEAAKQALIDAQQSIIDAQNEILAAEQAAEQARLDEEKQVEDIRKHVTKYCENEGYYCGVILNQDSLLALFKFAMENPNEQIKIPFQLYTNDN